VNEQLTRVWSWRGHRLAWPLAVAAVVVAEVAMLLYTGRHQFFFYDEWRLIVERSAPDPGSVGGWFQQLFRPDGEHVIGVPLTLFVLATRLFGIDTYWPFIVLNIAVRLATLWFADDIARRLGARRAARFWLLVVIAFFGQGHESLFAQSIIFAGFTLVFCLAAIRIAVIARDEPHRSQWWAGGSSAFLLTMAVFSSSYAFPAVVGVAVLFWLMSRRRAAVISLVVPPVAFLVVRALAGGSYSQQQPLSISRVPVYIDYVQAGTGAVGEGITGLDGLGFASFVLLLVAVVLIARRATTVQFALVMAGTVVLFFGQASLSRSVLGSSQATASRYVFFCGVLMLVAIAAAWGERRVGGRWLVIVAVLLLVSLASSFGKLIDGRSSYLTAMATSYQRVPVGFAANERGLTRFPPDPEWAPDLNGDRIDTVMNWSGSRELIAQGGACFDDLVAELDRLGVDTASLDARQRAALVLLLNEHVVGFGGPEMSFTDLLVFGAQGGTGSQVLDLLLEDYRYLVQVTPQIDAVPVVHRCS
jgi:uncharacterized membrane protein